VVAIDDIETAAVKAIELLNSDSLQQQTGLAARRHIIANFSVEKMISSVEQLCSELLKRL
jgi:glycosyltransferase involved in cell wall biosynthesis